jgi:hypothetical protein
MAFLKCGFCGGLYTPKEGFRSPSGACDSCWLEINSQAFKQRNAKKEEPVSTEPRTYEVGYLCENCLYPLEDTRPGVEDFRVAVGRTKRLCRKCAAIEDCPNRDAEGHGSLDGCSLCNPEKEQQTKELWKDIDNLNNDTDTLKRLQTTLERMYPASGAGPRTKMRRWRNDR